MGPVADGEPTSLGAQLYRDARVGRAGAGDNRWLRFWNGSVVPAARRLVVVDPLQGVFWVMLAGVFQLSRSLIEMMTAHVAVPDQNQLSELVLPERLGGCAPEPAEQLRFMLALVVPVCATVALTLLLRWSGCFKHQLGRNRWWLGALALAAQVVTLFVGTQALNHEFRSGHPYRFLAPKVLGWSAIAVCQLLTWPWVAPRLNGRVEKLVSWVRERDWLALIVVSCLVVAFSITGVYHDGEFRHTPSSIQFHVPFTLAEFAATVNGSTPLVDFFSQYQNLTSWILAPLFRTIGLGFGSFSTVMTGLTGIGLLLLFSSLARITQSRWTALLLMLLVLAFGFYSEELNERDGYRLTAFNYYAVGPLRYFGFCLLARVAVWYLEYPRTRRLIVAATLATLVALNNLDFGIPAAAGVLAAGLLFPPRRRRRSFLLDVLRAAGLYVAAALATFVAFAVVVRLLSEDWPQFTVIADFQKAFAMLGYFMLPLPRQGLYWLLYLTLMAAVIVPIYERLARPFDGISRNDRLINGSLAYTGIAAAGALAYYVGRSHPYTLETAFLAWGYALVQLAYRANRRWRHLHLGQSWGKLALATVPTLMAVGLMSLMLPMIREIPDPQVQYQRITRRWPNEDITDGGALALVQKYVREGEMAVIDYPNAHLLAIRAGVRNLFPFAHPGSLIIKAQHALVVAALDRLPHDSSAYFFGSPDSGLRERLTENSFRQIEATGEFEVWQRGATEANEPAPTVMLGRQ